MPAKSKYNLFVAQNIGKFKHLPPRERMASVAKLWKASGHTASRKKTTKRVKKGKGVVGNFVRDVGGLAQTYGSYIPW